MKGFWAVNTSISKTPQSYPKKPAWPAILTTRRKLMLDFLQDSLDFIKE